MTACVNRRICIVALTVLLATPAAAQDVAGLDAVFVRWSGDRPGCSLGIERAGAPPVTRSWGLAELEHRIPATPSTVYEAGSVSKQFTAAAILLLADDGRLSLDDDVRRWLPELPDYGRTITIRHMLNHTSGLRDWGSVVALEGWPRGSRAMEQSQVLEVVARQGALNFEPGSEWLYSNSGYNLAAIIVARISGQSFADFTRERLFGPLGMTHTGWRDDYTAIVPGRAAAYTPATGGYRLAMPFENAHGNGGLLTTVGDLLTWNRALTEGRLNLAERLAQPGVVAGRSTHYGFGLERNVHDGQAEIAHGGATGGYRTWLARYPDQRLSIALLCNTADANPEMLGRQVADLFLPESPETPPYVPTGPAPEGLFAGTRTGEPFGLRMTVRGPVVIPSGQPLTPVGPDVWRLGTDELRFEGRDRFARITEDGDSIIYERRQPVAPDAGALAAYAGTYVSDEARARWTLRVIEGRLALDQGGQPPVIIAPTYLDVFATPGFVLRFDRNPAGEVTVMHVNAGRARDVVFNRIP